MAFLEVSSTNYSHGDNSINDAGVNPTMGKVERSRCLESVCGTLLLCGFNIRVAIYKVKTGNR